MTEKKGFINRSQELEALGKTFALPGKKLGILYGRRRVGKTELLLEFGKKKKFFYFLADKRGTAHNAQRFAGECAESLNDVPPRVENFDDAFSYLEKRLQGEKAVIVIDEFSYLVEKDESVPSVFQKIVDNILKNSSVFLLLCGSSVSMMYHGTLSHQSPLYGRRDFQWKLEPLAFRDFRGFCPHLKFEDAVQRFAVVGGVPAYAARFQGGTLEQAIKESILAKGTYLYDEPEALLREELRDPSTYFSILEAAATNAKLTEIANAASVPAQDMPKYLKVLQDLQLMGKNYPVTEKKTKRTHYAIKDPFFRFWFRFVHPRKSALESGNADAAWPVVQRDLNAFVGHAFEEVCREYLERVRPAPFTKIGHWWGFDEKRNTVDIDWIALDENQKTLLAVECKWKKNVDAGRVAEELMEKTRAVNWQNAKRQTFYAVMARSFKEKPEHENAFFVDAKQMDEALKPQRKAVRIH